MKDCLPIDSYLLLIIFSHLDVKTLFGSCSRVCKEWYTLFFSSEQQQNINFHNTLIKICHLNATSQRLELSRQFRECYANDDSIYSQFDEIKLDFISDDENHHSGGNKPCLKLFHQLLRLMKNGGKSRMKKKPITINRECELIPFHREAKESIKQFYLVGKRDYRIDSVLSESNIYERIYSIYYPFIVFAKTNGFTLFSLVSGKQYCNHVFKSTVEMKQLEFKFHSQMQQYYKSKLQLDGECYIYSLYVYMKIDSNSFIKKFLFVDQLEGEIECIGECTFLEEPLNTLIHYSISVSDWDSNTMDAVLLTCNDCFTLCLEDGYKISFIIQSDSNNNINNNIQKKGKYPIIPIKFTNWKIGSVILSTNITNITKPLMREGISLIDSTKYSKFVVFELKICYQIIGPGFECKIYCDSLYVLIAKKQDKFIESSENNQPYSIMWKVAKRLGFDGMLQIDIGKRRHAIIADLKNSAKFFDQGRRLKIHTTFYGYNFLNGNISYIDDLSEEYWDFIDYTEIYNSWRYSDTMYSIENFEELDLKNSVIKERCLKDCKLVNISIVGHAEEYFYIIIEKRQNKYYYRTCIVNYNKLNSTRK